MKIFPIIAPPRTCSTMLGASLNMNSEIDGYCHEPFFRLRDNPNSFNESYEEIEKSGNNVIVKEMTQWLDINDEFIRFFTFARNPPVFIIRHPIIAAEDKLKKVVETFDMREKQAITDQLKRLGFDSLDAYAVSKGFDTWRNMMEKCFKDRDYKPFGDILKSDAIFNLNHLGWEAFGKQIEYLKSKNMNFLVVDANEHKKNSIESTKKICEIWGLNFEDKMVNWGKGNLKINTNQNAAYQQIWYEHLMQSSGIENTVDTVISLEMFPEYIAEYIEKVCIPIHKNHG